MFSAPANISCGESLSFVHVTEHIRHLLSNLFVLMSMLTMLGAAGGVVVSPALPFLSVLSSEFIVDFAAPVGS